jgi:cysteine desulfurase
MNAINLDHNATTPLHPAAAEAMARVEAEAPGNPSSAHQIGRKARQFLEDAREKVAHLLEALPEEVIFTSGATEANNLAIFGLAGEPPGRIVASLIEHPCVIEPLKALEVRGFTLDWLPVVANGTIDPAIVKARTAKDTRLVAMMLANHETGAILNVKAMVNAAPFHCDAAQAVGKIPVSFRDLSVTSLSLSAHKFGGPKGAGVLLLRKDTTLKPLMYGGHQQRSHRPGTESAPLAVGLATALELAVANLDENAAKWKMLRANFIQRLTKEVPPIIVNGDGLPNTVNVSFPGCRADVLLMALDLVGVACSTGSACSSGSLLPSPVLKAMRVYDEVLRSAMRFSFGAGTTDVDEAIERITYCVKNARR